MLELIEEVWTKRPDLRLTQLIVSLVNPSERCPQAFYFEDDELRRRLERLANDDLWPQRSEGPAR